MLLHLGGTAGVPLGRVVAVLSMESPSQDTAELIAAARKAGLVTEVCPPPHKSCVITAEGRKSKLVSVAHIGGLRCGRAESGGNERGSVKTDG